MSTWTSRRSEVVKIGNRTVRGFSDSVISRSLRDGCRSLLMTNGLGRMRANIAVFGFKHNWTKASLEETEEYVNMIRYSTAVFLFIELVYCSFD